jgi:hypothetical protein
MSLSSVLNRIFMELLYILLAHHYDRHCRLVQNRLDRWLDGVHNSFDVSAAADKLHGEVERLGPHEESLP